MTITQELIDKLNATIDKGLSCGLGTPVPGQMCVEAAVCYAMGLPHGDNPPCVSSVVRALKIALNDSTWSSATSRGNGMRRLAIAQLGTAEFSLAQNVEFARRVSVLAFERIVPLAAEYAEYAEYAEHAEHAKYAAKYAAEYAKHAAKSAEYAEYAEYAKHAAEHAAESAAKSAKYAAKYAAEHAVESAAIFDKILSDFAEGVVEILMDMKSPGSMWL